MKYEGGKNEFHSGNIHLEMDCMDLLHQTPDGHYALAIIDPPYGIDFARTHTGPGWISRPAKDWDKSIPSAEYFKELFRVSKNQIVWGGNYFTEYLPPSMGWVFWDKGQRDFSLADGELAWTSFDRALRVFGFSRAKLNKQRGEHPTEKPYQLYRWLLDKYATPGDNILDTHLGSMNIVKACRDYGFGITGSELDPEYFADGIKMIKDYLAAPKMDFTDEEDNSTSEQLTIL